MSAKIPSESFVGLKFNKLSIISALPNVNGYRYVTVKCDCGTIKICSLDNVRSGKSKSCGCYERKYNQSGGYGWKKHGLVDHPLYKTWCGIKYRCYNKKAREYKWYGAEGVTVCNEWINDFKSFYDWAMSHGWQKGLEIDKDIKGGKIYSPENCVFVTKKENCNNRRSNTHLTFNGETLTIAQWSDKIGLTQGAICRRLYKGWGIDKSLSSPPMVNQFG